MQTNIIDFINFIPPEISSIQLPNSNILKNLLIFEKLYFKENWLLSIQCKLKLPVQFSVNNLFTFQATINNSSNFPHNLHIGSKENHSKHEAALEHEVEGGRNEMSKNMRRNIWLVSLWDSFCVFPERFADKNISRVCIYHIRTQTSRFHVCRSKKHELMHI